MSDQNKSDEKSSLTTPGIALVAILLSFFAAQETIFKPTRPAMIDSERAFSEEARSRLWQDPFQAVEEHRKNYQNQITPINLLISEEISHALKNTDKQGKNVLIEIPEISDQFGYEYSQEPTRVCYEKEMVSERKTTYEDSKILTHSIEELSCKINLEKGEEKNDLRVHVFAIMVPGGPYAEDKERRLRARYAVISALTEQSYKPRDPEHIEFVDFKSTCNAALQELSHNKKSNNQLENEKYEELIDKVNFCQMGTFMPYEWFHRKYKDSSKSILVIWLNSDGLVNSYQPQILRQLAFLKKKLNSKNSIDHFSIIGPHGSDALNKMYREIARLEDTTGSADILENPIFKELNDSYIYTPTATVQRDGLYKPLYEENIDGFNQKIVRTISTQDQLAKTIYCELALRGVKLKSSGKQDSKEDTCIGTLTKSHSQRENSQAHHIALIGERDTFYSQRLTESLREMIVLNEHDSERVHTFHYLRGLDGITSEHTSGSQSQIKNKNNESQENKPIEKETLQQKDRPTGPSQLDYLRSMAEELIKLDKKVAQEGGIKVIGITGSDTYDKLLILQALRNKFPETLFLLQILMHGCFIRLKPSGRAI